MSEPVRILALIGPITVATLLCSLAARGLIRRAGLAWTMIAIAVVASLLTVLDLLVLNHFMLVDPGNRAEVGFVALYSLTAGVAAALIVGRSNDRAIRRLVATARSLGQNDLEARAGDLRASPELQLLARTLDQAAERLAAAIDAERRIEAQRRDLVTSLSHDLRTPLSGLRSMVEAINDGVVDDPETVRRYAREMLSSVMALVAMVDDLFELAQLDASALAQDARTTSVAEAVGRALDVCRHEARVKGVALAAELGPAGADRCSPRLERVMLSLISNGVRYTPAGGRVTVRASRSPEQLRIAVQDTGQGIAADQLPRVFEPFWRADSARSTRGSGLGLTLAKRIVEALGGQIEATSAPDSGTRFDVSLPAGT